MNLSCTSLYTKTNSKWNIGFNVEAQTTKLLEEINEKKTHFVILI